LLTGYSAGVTSIDKKAITECANDLQVTGNIINFMEDKSQDDKAAANPDLIRRSQKQKVAMSLIVMVLLSIAGYFMYNFQLEESPQWRLEDIAKKKNLILSEEEKKALITQSSEESQAQKKKMATKTRAQETNAEKMHESSTKQAMIVKDTESSLHDKKDQSGIDSQSANIIQAPGQKTVVHFKHNSNEIPDQAFESLKRIVRFASHKPKSEIIVEGYTDSFGNYEYNKKLSKFRADIIKSYFAGQGIPVSRIKTYGMGPENPIATNNTFEGRKKNRRVEIRINNKE
jgi:general secretion pathway protein A